MIFDFIGLMFFVVVLVSLFVWIRNKHRGLDLFPIPSADRIALDKQKIAGMPAVTIPNVLVIGRG